jgi:rRNA maturation endonuclease Nob1
MKPQPVVPTEERKMPAGYVFMVDRGTEPEPGRHNCAACKNMLWVLDRKGELKPCPYCGGPAINPTPRRVP